MSRGDGLARLREALEEHGCTVRGSNAQCPAHEDCTPSLSIGQGRDGALLNCHYGCETDAVLEALGMSAADLFDEPKDSKPDRPQVVAEYRYTDETGQLLFVKERRVPKDFRLRRPDGRGGWTWGLGDARRVLYNLPAVLAAVNAGQQVYVAEGEKDADAIGRAGAVATCNFEGAAKEGQRPKWRPEYGDVLKGATVIVVADKDPAGYAHAAAVRADLDGKAASVTVLEAAEGKDAADHLAAGLALSELKPAGQAPTRLDQLRCALLDSDGLDKLPAPEPLIDGLLYRDSLAWLHGKPGHGKSLLALEWACCIAAGLDWLRRPVTGGAVLYVIAEGATGLRARVRAWEDRAEQKTGVRFLPVAVQMLQPGEPEAVAALAAELACVLVVLDTQARVAVGADENSSQDMGRLVEAADKIRTASGACVQLVHHEARAGDNMRGSTALEGAATTILRVVKDGSRLELTNPKQKDSAEADPLTLWVVPRLQSVVIADQPDSPTLDLRAESENKILKTLLDLFGTTGAAATTLREATGLSKSTFHWALNRLVKDGIVQNLGSRTRTCYVLAQTALPAEVQQVQQGPSPTGPMSNGTSSRSAIGLSPLDRWPDDRAEAQATP